MRLYDRIFVLKEGRISEAGTWEELMEKKRDFYRLAAVEQGGEQIVLGGLLYV